MAFIVKLYDRFIDGLAIIASAMLAIIFVGIVIDVSLRTAGFNSLQWYSAVAPGLDTRKPMAARGSRRAARGKSNATIRQWLSSRARHHQARGAGQSETRSDHRPRTRGKFI